MSSQVKADAVVSEAEKAPNGSAVDRAPPSGDPTAVGDRPEPPARTRPSSSPTETPKHGGVTHDDLQRILKIEVPVIVRLAHRPMRIKDVMQLASGSIIEFDRLADGALDLMINNEIIGHGEAVKVGENFGLRVLSILNMRDKIEVLRNAGP